MSYGMNGWNKPDGDLISRAAALDAPEKYIKDCNPEHFVGHQKFIEFMDNAEIGSFGNWQFANGFNMGLTAAEVAIRKLPSAQPDVADTNVGDMISRQASLNACKNPGDGENAYAFGDDIEKRLMALPSAQPEIIRCRDCRYWGAYPSSSATPWLHECYARIARLHTAADEFCSRAERREVSE